MTKHNHDNYDPDDIMPDYDKGSSDDRQVDGKKEVYNDTEYHESNDFSGKGKKSKKPDNKVAAWEAEKETLNEKYLRLYSEFDNYRRRTAKERLDLTQRATESLIKELLPVLDDFDRALENISAEDEKTKGLRSGVELIHNKLLHVLGQKGLKQIEIEIGDEFDIDYQEAITTIPAPLDELKNKIVDVIEKGYMLGDTVIRFAKVVVGA